MNEHPMVSIIVPAYNAAGYIEGCVNSVLTQSCGSFELLKGRHCRRRLRDGGEGRAREAADR